MENIQFWWTQIFIVQAKKRRFVMKDLHVQDSGIGITIYALLQFHFKTTLPIN
jgi:hypothetical protein